MPSSPGTATSPPVSCRRWTVITGRGHLFHPVAVTELSATDIEALLRDTMERTGVHVIFTDLRAGSCTMAARRILRGMPSAVLVSGANLPTLLDFVFADAETAVTAARHAAERGRASIDAVEGTP